MNARSIQTKLLLEGWILKKGRGQGSHRIFSHPEKRGIIVLPWHRNGASTLPAGTFASLAKVAGWKH